MLIKLRNKDGFSKLMEIEKYEPAIQIPQYSNSAVFVNHDATIQNQITTHVKEYTHLNLHEDLFGINVLLYEEN